MNTPQSIPQVQSNPRKEAIDKIRSVSYENATVQDLKKIQKALAKELSLVRYYINALK